MSTPNNPTPNYQLDRRVTNGNPFPAELYDDNMEKIDAGMKAALDAAATKLPKAGGDMTGYMRFLMDGLFMAFGSNSDKFCIHRYDSNYHLLYNAYHNGSNWVFYDNSLPAFRMTFTQVGRLELYTAPPGPNVVWTKRMEVSASQLLSSAPFAAATTATFGGQATFNAEAVFNHPATFNQLVSLAGGFNLGNTLQEGFEGIWQVLGQNADKFTVQRVTSENSVYLAYNLFHNGSAWQLRDNTKPSTAIQHTATGEVRIRFAPAGSITWQTIMTVNSTDLVVNKRLSVTGEDFGAIFGTSTDKLVIIRDPSNGTYSLAYNVNHADASTKQDTTKASTRISFTNSGLVQIWHAPAGASNAWTKAFEASSSVITLSRAVTLAAQLTSQVATGTPPFVVASTTAVANLNSDMVDGVHAAAIPHTNNRNALYDYTSAWTSVVRGAAYTFTHNLGVVPRLVIIQFRPGTSGEATSTLYPAAFRGGSDDMVICYHTDVNNLRVVTPTSTTGYAVGVNASGTEQTSGQYRVLAIK